METESLIPHFEGPVELNSITKCMISVIEDSEWEQLRKEPHRFRNVSNYNLRTFLEMKFVEKIQGRKISVFYMSEFYGSYVKLAQDSFSDFGNRPEFVVTIEGPSKLFCQTRVMSERNTIKKFKSLILRVPQEEALFKMQDALKSREASRFMIILPTGCGKTMVMGLAPFFLNASAVLIITPNKTICDQVKKDLFDLFMSGSDISNSMGGVMPTVGEFDKNKSTCKTDFVVVNVQALVKGSGDDESEPTLRDEASILLKNRKFDVCLVDEGHHCPAVSWKAVEKRLLELNDNCRTVLLTATPMRGDGLSYNLPNDNGKFYYLFPRDHAVRDSYIKSTTYHPISCLQQTCYCSDDYLTAMLDPAVLKLKDLRKSCNNFPLKLLINAKDTKSAKKISDFFNARSLKLDWNLKCVAITGATAPENVKNRRGFESNDSSDETFVDAVVQCQMLGEGYDNSLIAISVCIQPPGSVGVLSQFHGRALRLLKDAKYLNLPQAKVSHLFYPKWDRVQKVVEDYKLGKDESTENLFDDSGYKSLRDAHTQFGKLPTVTLVEKLRSTFYLYHEKYSEKRKSWKCVPAEFLAEEVYKKYTSDHSSNCKIVDFGCGEDGLFEVKLLDLLKSRDKLYGKIEVEVLALDVVAFSDADGLAYHDQNVRFTCKTIEGDYTSAGVEGQYDVGIFCLSMMASDSLELGLLQAMRTVKPSSKIIIVQDLFKFGLTHSLSTEEKNNVLSSWSQCFSDRTGFRVVSNEMIPNSTSVMLVIMNVTCDENTAVMSKIKNVSFKSLILNKSSSKALSRRALPISRVNVSGVKRGHDEGLEDLCIDKVDYDTCIGDVLLTPGGSDFGYEP